MESKIEKRAIEIYLYGEGTYEEAYRQAKQEFALKDQVPPELLKMFGGGR